MHFCRRTGSRVPGWSIAAGLLLAHGALYAQGNGPARTAGLAAPTYRAGLKSIAIPAPTADLVEIGPDYRVLFEPFAPNTNRLMAAFVLPADVPQIRTGLATDFTKYALVEVPRGAEFLTVTPEMFKQVSSSMASQFGASLDTSLKNGTDELNQRLKDMNSSAPTITIDKPVQLGTLFSEPDACGFGLIALESTANESRKMATAVGIVRVQSRIIYAYLFEDYKDETTVQSLRKASEAWANAILNANR
jgi:hypothetical protein